MTDRTFLGWPFFEQRHRELAARLEEWCGTNLPVADDDVGIDEGALANYAVGADDGAAAHGRELPYPGARSQRRPVLNVGKGVDESSGVDHDLIFGARRRGLTSRCATRRAPACGHR